LEELQAARASEALKVWEFLSQSETTLLPPGFSLVRPKDLVEEISVVLPLLDSTRAKMLQLEEVIGSQVEAEGHVLAEEVAEHMLMCF
jgi:hypothetical protein